MCRPSITPGETINVSQTHLLSSVYRSKHHFNDLIPVKQKEKSSCESRNHSWLRMGFLSRKSTQRTTVSKWLLEFRSLNIPLRPLCVPKQEVQVMWCCCSQRLYSAKSPNTNSSTFLQSCKAALDIVANLMKSSFRLKIQSNLVEMHKHHLQCLVTATLLK